MSDKYEIRTVADFLALAPEKRAVAISEFAHWCDMHDAFKAIAEATGLTIKTDATVYQWIDDGKGEVNFIGKYKGEEVIRTTMKIGDAL